MMRVVVVERSAEGRSRLTSRLERYLQDMVAEAGILPRISLKPLCPEELVFHEAPDACVIGEELIAEKSFDFKQIKQIFPETAIIAQLGKAHEDFATSELLSRRGVDDFLAEDETARHFSRKLLLHMRKRSKKPSGKIILVEGGKGGVGVTSMVGALGEILVAENKRTVLVDLDFETQDLSRFLRARPFINENLQMLLEHRLPLTAESVAQALVHPWTDRQNLECMCPPLEYADSSYEIAGQKIRTFLAVLETLASQFDCIVIDAGSANEGLLQSLYRLCDVLICVASTDPAALFASTEKVSRSHPFLSHTARHLIVTNAPLPGGLSLRDMHGEFLAVPQFSECTWVETGFPWCERASRWPGSGKTLVSTGNSMLREAMKRVLEAAELIPAEKLQIKMHQRWMSTLKKYAQKTATAHAGTVHRALLGLPLPSSETSSNFNSVKMNDKRELPEWSFGGERGQAASLSSTSLVSAPRLM